MATIYIQIFEACNFCGSHSKLVICEILILPISLANIWPATIGEQDKCESLCLTFAKEDGKFLPF